MSRTRKPISFAGYDGKVKKGKKWELIGRYRTLEDAREAGATKCTPRYSR